MNEVSEFARQLYEVILARGYNSPESTWEGLEILNELRIKSADSYGWLKELENAGLIIRSRSSSISNLDRFYAVPSLGQRSGTPALADGSRQPLSQDKVEHAILWSLVRQSYDDDDYADAPAVRRCLRGFATEQQVRAGLLHLLECGLIRDCSAPMQEHYEPTREGIQRIEKLEGKKLSFVARLGAEGPEWLGTKWARDADLASRFIKQNPASAVPPPAMQGPVPGVTINNIVSPTQNNVAPPSSSLEEQARLARSGARAGWVNAVVALLVGAAVIAVTIWLAR